MKSINGQRAYSLKEVGLNRFFTEALDKGCIIVSASRGSFYRAVDGKRVKYSTEETAEFNKIRTQQLKDLIKERGLSFYPVYGGFIEKTKDESGAEIEREVQEDSFVVMPYNYAKGTKISIDELHDFGLEVIQLAEGQIDNDTFEEGYEPTETYGCFSQDAFLLCDPNAKPMYITANDQVDMVFNGRTANDLAQEYFTSLRKFNIPKDSEDSFRNQVPRRFSFVESYVTPVVGTIMGCHIKETSGEIILNSYRYEHKKIIESLER